MYKFPISALNHCGLIATMYMPIKQPGETGPKPIMAKRANTERHLICVGFIIMCFDLTMQLNPSGREAENRILRFRKLHPSNSPLYILFLTLTAQLAFQLLLELLSP
jgi:hypothetical protein